MAGYNFAPKGPRTGFVAANALSNAVSQYAKGRMQAAQMAALAEQRSAMSHYRMAQAELARQRSIPADFNKIQLMRTLANGGMLDPATVKNFEKQYVPQILAKMKPAEVEAAKQRFESDANQGQMSPEFNQYMTINPTEEKLMASYNMADAGVGRAGMALEGVKYKADQDFHAKQDQLAAQGKWKEWEVNAKKYAADQQLKAAQTRAQATTTSAGIHAGAQVKSAEIHGKATTGAAAIRAHAPGRSGTVQDPYTKALLQQQKDAEKQLGELNNPKSPFGAAGPERDKLIQHYEQQRQDAIDKLQQHKPAAQAPQPFQNGAGPLAPNTSPKGPNIVPASPDAAKNAPAGAFMQHPEKGWIQKNDANQWVPAQDPNAARSPQSVAPPIPATGQPMYQPQPTTQSAPLQVEPIGAQ